MLQQSIFQRPVQHKASSALHSLWNIHSTILQISSKATIECQHPSPNGKLFARLACSAMKRSRSINAFILDIASMRLPSSSRTTSSCPIAKIQRCLEGQIPQQQSTRELVPKQIAWLDIRLGDGVRNILKRLVRIILTQHAGVLHS